MHVEPRLCLAALLCVATSCKNEGSAGHVGSPGSGEVAKPVSVQPLPEAGRVRDYGTKRRLVIRDAAAWASLWKDLTRTEQPVPDVPAVDFENNVLIIAAAGTKPSAGYGIEVDDLRITADGATIAITEHAPGIGCSVLTVVTAPVAIVVAPRFTGQATFVEHTSQHDCR